MYSRAVVPWKTFSRLCRVLAPLKRILVTPLDCTTAARRQHELSDLAVLEELRIFRMLTGEISYEKLLSGPSRKIVLLLLV